MLEHHAVELAEPSLRTILRQDNLVQFITPNGCVDSNNDSIPREREVSLTQVRQLARQELVRRGLEA